MVKLLRNELSTITKLDQGWFGLRNRKPVEADISDQERDKNESNLFRKPEWDEVPAGRTGIKALMDYIDKQRRSHIRESLPKIISEIQKNLRNCETELEKLGEVRDNTAAQRYYAFQFCNNLQNMADAALRARYQDIPSDDYKIRLRYLVSERLKKFQSDLQQAKPGLQFKPIENDLDILSAWNANPVTWVKGIVTTPTVYGEIYRESKVCQGTNLPGTISADVEEKIFRKQSAHWNDIAVELVDDIKSLVKESNDIFLQLAIPDTRTRSEVISMTAKAREAWDAEIHAGLTELIDDNQKRPLMTLQYYLLAESEKFDSSLWEQIEHSRKRMRGKGEEAEGNAIINSDDGKTGLSLEMKQIFHVRKRLELYYEIALNRFIDNVAMQVVERHVLGPNCPIFAVSTKLMANLNDDDINRIAGEDEAVTQQRARLNEDRTRYKKALAQWEQVRSA
jgi:Dynamin central region